jgi:hypothetical protein
LKKLFSSIFVALILFNVMGYYGVFLGLQYKNAYDLMRQFDSETYDQTLTEVIKIPFNAPDSLSSELFERADGDFERDGEVYRVIKKRQYRDTFHIVYIKDAKGTAINKALAEVAKTFADQPTEKGSSHKTIVPSFIKEYLAGTMRMQSSTKGWEESIRKENKPTIFIATFIASIVHPPERA